MEVEATHVSSGGDITEGSAECTDIGVVNSANNSNACQSVEKGVKDVFTVEMSFIPKVDEHENDVEHLGVEAYHIDVLEEAIIKQVDQAIEKELQASHQKSILLAALSSKKPKLLTKANTKALIGKKCALEDGEIADEVTCDAVVPKPGPAEPRPETEMERKIRMGEMTPFGNVLGSSSDSHMTGFEKYLASQNALHNSSKVTKNARKSKEAVKNQQRVGVTSSGADTPGTSGTSPAKHRSPLKRRILQPKKRRRKSPLGSHTSEAYEDLQKLPGRPRSESTAMEVSSGSDSEYLPEGSDEEFSEGGRVPPLPRARQRRPRRQPEGDEEWHTDDEDWEDSGDETPTRRSKGGREVDDGVMDDYLRRVAAWERQNNREELQADCRELDHGFKVPNIIWDKLYKYQRVGVQWLWELHQQRCGGILGDEMGLGKTVQVIAFLTGLAVSKLLSKHGNFRGLGPVLIVCPTTIMHQWVGELHKWWGPLRAALLHTSGAHHGTKKALIQDVVNHNGILITSYSGCMQQIDLIGRYRWHYVILDEGHKIRNPESQVAVAVKLVRTPHRIILSGSPMQNNLRELWSLFDFIFPGKLGTLPVFMAEFAVPITQGGYSNATQVQVATAYKCATVLRDTISPYLLRRMKSDVKTHINLPNKNEQVLFCNLTQEQRSLYREYLSSGEVGRILEGRYKVFVGLINLRKICNHPDLYSGGPKLFKWDDPEALAADQTYGYWERAGKMVVVKTLLHLWKKQEHRVLIFTQSKQMLAVLVAFVQSLGYEYLKLDGDTNIAARQPLINKFNQESKYFVFLATTHVGGLGVNLTGADRVVIYDPDWNPATDTQARERAWRIGQRNQVTIYRLVTAGTIEEKIYHRQIFKQFLTNKVLKDPRQRRFFKSNDLYELFTLKETDDHLTETSALFAGTGSEISPSQLTHKDKVKKIRDEIGMSSGPSPVCRSALPQEKIDAMKKMAQMLSKQIASGDAPTTATRSAAEGKKKKKKRRKVLFEGEEVPLLVKQKTYRKADSEDVDYTKQDDYILKKLFSKSGIQTAMKHDKMMEEGPADYALVEAEAEKVARDAVKALKESREAYREAQEVQARQPPKPRFKGRIGNRKPAVGNENDNPMAVDELMARIRERNALTSSADMTPQARAPPLEENSELLADIRNFVAFGATNDSQAATQELLEKFRDRLPAGKSPIFKALLNEICEFYRTSEGEGMWRLRPEYRW